MKKASIIFALLATASIFASTVSAQVDKGEPKFRILAPLEGQTLYGTKVPILFAVENFTLIEAQKAIPEQGHILVWLDSTDQSADSATKVISDTFTFSDVSYGDHTLKASLVSSDNKPLNPPLEQTVKFKTSELPSSTPPEATTFDKRTTAVILVIVALVIIAAWWYTKDEEIDEKPAKTTTTAKRKSTRKKRK